MGTKNINGAFDKQLVMFCIDKSICWMINVLIILKLLLFRVFIFLNAILYSAFPFPHLQDVIKSKCNVFRCQTPQTLFRGGMSNIASGNSELSEGNWVDCVGHERISLEQTHCLFIYFFFTPLDHSVPAVSHHLGPPLAAVPAFRGQRGGNWH